MPMPSLQAMGIFAHVVDAGSFTEAARRVGVSKSAVSKAVAALEEDLGVRLLLRTTRKLRMTEAGERFHESCARVLAEAERARADVGLLDGAPRGTVRVNAPLALGRRFAMPIVLDFMERYPEVEIHLTLQDDVVDIVATRTDLALRVGRLVDSSLIARRLAPVGGLLVASPSYLARHGTPATPDDLVRHTFIAYSLTASPERLTLDRDGERVTLNLPARLHTNNGEAIRDAVIAGAGFAMLPDFIIAEAYASGQVVPILPDWTPPSPMHIYAVYAQGGPLSPPLRLLIDTLVANAGRLGCPRGA